MENRYFSIQGFDPQNAALDGNRFLCANGYMGLRGMPEEADSGLLPAITLAGVYDRFEERWREPVNAPNCLSVRLKWNGEPAALGRGGQLSHTSRIDYLYGVYERETVFPQLAIRSRRFVSMDQCHLLLDEYRLEALSDGTLEIRAGISTDIWDINGPHLFSFRAGTGALQTVRAVTGQQGITVAAAQLAVPDFDASQEDSADGGAFRVWKKAVRRGENLTLRLYAAVYTSLDIKEPEQAAKCACERAAEKGFEPCLQAHQAVWDRIWDQSGIRLEGDERAALYLRASQYHLNCIAPRHAENLSIPARGLSGQTYKGAVFWDAEMFCFPMFVHTQPEIARSLLEYRVDTLPGARKKAAEYGYRGAFYAWESQEGGEEGCTNFNVVDVFTHRPVRTYFRDRQIHISADIAYALSAWYDNTGDRSLLMEGGAEVILECARFYVSRANAHADTEEIDYLDVIGPDEYHERVNNNAFTNRMIRHCLESALRLEGIFADMPAWFSDLLSRLDFDRDFALIKALLPRIRELRKKDGVMEQFDGYFALEDCGLDAVRQRLRDPREYWGGDHGVAGQTQVIKQADVIALMALLPREFTDEEVRLNWEYYEPRTEHGSSLSACMYALTAIRVGKLDEAWELFLRTASIDVTGGGKQWAGEIYIGGTHPASNGGAWMIAALGFAGLTVRGGRPELHPNLPRALTRLTVPFSAGGKRYWAVVTRDTAEIREIQDENK